MHVDPVSGGDPHDVSKVLGEVVGGREELVPDVILHITIKSHLNRIVSSPRQLKVGPRPNWSAIYLQVQLQESSISPEPRPRQEA